MSSPRTPSTCPSPIESDFQIPILIALLHRRAKMLAAIFDPFDRPAQAQTGGRDHDFLRIEHELGAEAAADVRRHDANAVLVEAEQPHQEGPHLVGELGRRPQREPVLVGVIDRDGAAALHRMRAAAVLLETDARGMRRARKRRRDIAVALAEFDEQVAGLAAMRKRRARAQRRAAIGNRRQRLVIDLDESGRVFGDGARLRHHDRDGLADEGDFILGENERRHVRRQLIGAELQRQPLGRQQRRNIGLREHRMHAGQAARSGGVDAADAGVRVRAAHERRLQHSGKFQIVDEAAIARESAARLRAAAPDGRPPYSRSRCSLPEVTHRYARRRP